MTRKRKQSDLAEFDPSKYLDDDEAVAEYVRLAMEDGDPGLLAAALGYVLGKLPAETHLKVPVSKAKAVKTRPARKAAPYRAHDVATVESFRKDPAFAAEYLNQVLAEGDQEELMMALRYMADAFGGVPKLAARAQLNATTLYRTLSPKGNPELRSMQALLGAMGMRIAVRPITEDAH